MGYYRDTDVEFIMGKRNMVVDGKVAIPFDQPCELGYHCPICNYPHEIGGNYDERLKWSEFEGFLWCSVCERDIPSCLCIPINGNIEKPEGTREWQYSGLNDAIDVFLGTVHRAKVTEEEIRNGRIQK
jgi:hypothetical protein